MSGSDPFRQSALSSSGTPTLGSNNPWAVKAAAAAAARPRQPGPPPRSSSYATVVPAATPLEAPIGTNAFFDVNDGSAAAGPTPPTPKEYATPSHTKLTPLRAHYLKRELVGGQLAIELNSLGDPNALSTIGWPFDQRQLPAGTAGNGSESGADLPFLRFFLHHFVMTFPFLAQVDTNIFYSKKLQPFIESFLARNISVNDEREEETGIQTKRHKLAGKAEKHLGLLISSAVKLADNDGREEVVRIVDVKAAPVAPAPIGKGSQPGTPSKSGVTQPVVFQVNVVGVRTVTERARLGRKVRHEQFIVRTSKSGTDDVFVSRRYGDFVTLSEMLRNEYPDYEIRPPPPKDRRGTESTGGQVPANPLSATRTSHDDDNVSLSDMSAPVTLARERNRLTLRAYLRQLLSSQDIANSPIVQNFLLHDPITLSQAEETDALRREEMDRTREAEQDKFKAEVSGRVRELERYLRGFKDELVKKDGLTRVFSTIRETPRLDQLPMEYQKVMEWARISLASTIYQLFLGTDQSSAIFAQFKRVHGLMPYFMMRQVLKISNPVAMIRSAMDLFLARPFGSASLLQRIFSGGIDSEVKELRDDMSKVEEKVQEPVLCERVKRYVSAPREVQQRFRAEAKAENLDILTVIMRSREEPFPPLSIQTLQRVHRASIKYKEYQEWVATLENPDEEDEGPEDDDAWLFEDLHVLMRMAMRLRDKEQLLELIFEGSTSDLLKDIITIFYEPLAKVYKAANISDSLYDLQMFVGDLIKTVEAAEAGAASSSIDPQKTVTLFMDLVQRHEQQFYHFVHSVHSKGEDLFDGLMHWIELFLNFIREGLNPDGVTLDFLLPHAGQEREDVMKEIDSLIDYHRTLKIAHHERLRRRLMKGEANSAAASYTTGSGVVGGPGQVGFGGNSAADKQQDAAFVEGVLSNLSMSGVADDIDDLNAEMDDESDDDDDQQFYDTGDSPADSPAPTPSWSAPKVPSNNPYATQMQQRQHASQMPSSSHQTTQVIYLPPTAPTPTSATSKSGSGKKSGMKRPKATAIVEPELVHIPRLIPVFTEMLRPSLETAQRVQQLKAQQQKPGKGVQQAQSLLR